MQLLIRIVDETTTKYNLTCVYMLQTNIIIFHELGSPNSSSQL